MVVVMLGSGSKQRSARSIRGGAPKLRMPRLTARGIKHTHKDGWNLVDRRKLSYRAALRSPRSCQPGTSRQTYMQQLQHRQRRQLRLSPAPLPPPCVAPPGIGYSCSTTTTVGSSAAAAATASAAAVPTEAACCCHCCTVCTAESPEAEKPSSDALAGSAGVIARMEMTPPMRGRAIDTRRVCSAGTSHLQ